MAPPHRGRQVNGKPALVRRHRAAVARRLLPIAPALVARLDWAELESAPSWLTLPDPELMCLALRIGALRNAPLLRMWIDAPRLAAASHAVGSGFLQAVLAQGEAQVPLAPDLMEEPAIGTADRVIPVLRATGLAVLLASLPPGSLRDATAASWAPAGAAAMSVAIAQMLIARVESLASKAEPQPARKDSSPAGAAEQRAGRGEHA
jgi:hypothetical protein